MKIVVNRSFGGFCLGYEFCKQYRVEPYDDYYDENREDRDLVEWVEKYPEDNKNLSVVEIPNEATDWEINEHDGFERVIVVIDGQITWL